MPRSSCQVWSTACLSRTRLSTSRRVWTLWPTSPSRAATVARAQDTLRTLEAFPSVRASWNFPSYLPEMVRLSLVAVDLPFAERLAEGLPSLPMELHRISRAMVGAELAEARGDLEDAADGYANAAEGWRVFSIPELGQAFLGRVDASSRWTTRPPRPSCAKPARCSPRSRRVSSSPRSTSCSNAPFA